MSIHQDASSLLDLRLRKVAAMGRYLGADRTEAGAAVGHQMRAGGYYGLHPSNATAVNRSL
jgi:hypothetical protein